MKKRRQYRGGFTYAGALRLALGQRQDPTDAEELLWDRLRNRRLLGFKFRRQHQIGKYVTDFYCNEAKLVIECDGKIHEQRDNWHHDQARDAYLSALGVRILRFTNEQVLKETQHVLSVISEDLMKR